MTYEEFYREYWKYTVNYITKHYPYVALAGEAEDYASEVITRFIERDFMSEYDPDKGVFARFWTGFIKAYMQGHDQRHKFRNKVFGVVFDQPLEHDHSRTVGDWYAPYHEFENELIDLLDYERKMQAIGQEMHSKPAFKAGYKHYYSEAWDSLKEVLEGEPHRYYDISAEFTKVMTAKTGISLSSAANWRQRLQNELKEAV